MSEVLYAEQTGMRTTITNRSIRRTAFRVCAGADAKWSSVTSLVLYRGTG